VIIVPEQIGKICPVLVDLTMKAPVLRKVLVESTKPYVIAEAFGDSNNDAVNRLVVSTKKPIRRFMGSPYDLGLQDGRAREFYLWKASLSKSAAGCACSGATKMPRLLSRHFLHSVIKD
jgi:hypothetical protein